MNKAVRRLFLGTVLLALLIVTVSANTSVIVNFTATPTTGTSPLTVQFTDNSYGGNMTWRCWDFQNDGMIDSFEQNPVFTYQESGYYSVNLTVYTVEGTHSTLVKDDYILVSSPGPVADFSAAPRSGTAPMVVQFTDLSTGPGIWSWAWDFQSDGTIDSTAQNPLYTYAAGGAYSVTLTVTNAGGSDTTVKNNYINVTNVPEPVAQFTATPTSGKRPLTVQFTDQSSGIGITSWAWDFQNDGIIDSHAQNPAFTYTSRGYYSVTLTVTNNGGSSSLTRWNYIRVK